MPSPTIFSFSVRDSMGTPATIPFFVAYDATTETVSALIATAAVLGGHLDAIIDAKITGFSISINNLPDPSWKASPVADSIVERTALANFLPLDSIYPEPIDVACISLSVLDAKGRVDLANSAWVAFRNDVIQATGIGGSAEVFVNNKFLLALRVFQNVSTTFRKHKKPVKAETKETP